jgi:hypothetical protein
VVQSVFSSFVQQEAVEESAELETKSARCSNHPSRSPLRLPALVLGFDIVTSTGCKDSRSIRLDTLRSLHRRAMLDIYHTDRAAAAISLEL